MFCRGQVLLVLGGSMLQYMNTQSCLKYHKCSYSIAAHSELIATCEEISCTIQAILIFKMVASHDENLNQSMYVQIDYP